MDENQRKTIEDWIEKAGRHLEAAKAHLDSSGRYSESIEASQECVELSVKAVLSLLGIRYTPRHEWEPTKKEFSCIAKQIRERQILSKLRKQYLQHSIPLPRLLFLMNFWAQFYIPAKYGFEVELLSSAEDLFRKEDAELAVRHAEECHRAAQELKWLEKNKLASIVG